MQVKMMNTQRVMQLLRLVCSICMGLFPMHWAVRGSQGAAACKVAQSQCTVANPAQMFSLTCSLTRVKGNLKDVGGLRRIEV